MVLRLLKTESETIHNETDSGDSLLLSLDPADCVVTKLEGTNHCY